MYTANRGVGITLKIYGAVVATAFPLWTCGCASIAEGTTQPIYVSTTPAGADCVLSNTRGKWSVVSPGAVVVKKSESVLKASCSKAGWQVAIAYLTPKVPTSALIGMMLPYAGLVSAAVDGSTGSGNQYPGTVSLAMKPSATELAPGEPTATLPAGVNAVSQK